MKKRWKSARDAAKTYIPRGCRVVPVPKGKKGPRIRDWTELRIQADEISTYFRPDDNIGILTGEPSGNLIDIDLDAPEAVRLASEWLPDTSMVHGRPGKQRSHYWYSADQCPASKKYLDVDGTCLAEIRASGHQTLAPSSIRADGERVAWAEFGDPGLVDESDLCTRVSRLAAAALLARHWPKKKSCRQDLALAVAGYLLRQGLDETTVSRLLESAAKVAGDGEWRKRVQTVMSTADKLESDEAVTGGPRVISLLGDGGEEVLEKLADWLGLGSSPGTRRVEAVDHMPYEATPQGLVWAKPTKNGSVAVLLTNFTARIIEEVVEDDGIEERRVLKIEAECRGRPSKFRITAEQFHNMSWVPKHLGANAILYPGYGARDHARAAIQILSGEVPEERHYAHTGWRQIGDEWHFLHAGGSIGPVGPVENNTRVHLTGALAGFVLPPPPTGKVVAAIRASLRVLELAPMPVIVGAYASVWRAPLGNCDLSMFLVGKTGVGKTEIAALMQQHFGAGMDARNLPGSWSSTANALEEQLCAAKDVVFVADDFAPGGSRYEIDKLHGAAGRIVRAQGNRAGRARMRQDTTLRPLRPPRGLMLATGEDLPRGQSVRARIVGGELAEGDLDWNTLSTCQKEAASGLYAQAMAGFVRFLSPVYGEVRQGLANDIAALRQFGEGAHRRTPTATASLAVGLRYFLAFARWAGAVDSDEAERLWARCWQGLQEAAVAQEAHVASADPVGRFLELLTAALNAGRAHVTTLSGEAPKHPEGWGWRRAQSIPGDVDLLSFIDTYRPLGERIGWLSEQNGSLYLVPDVAYGVVQRMARDGGDPLPVQERTLRKRLHEAGLLLSTDGDARLTVRKTIQGRRHRVLHLSDDLLLPSCQRAGQPGHQGKVPPLLSGLAERLVAAQLLIDIRDVFDQKNTDRLLTKTLLAALHKKNRRRRGRSRSDEKLSAVRLSRRLQEFGIRPRDIWNPKTKTSKRGYKLEQFENAFKTLLPPERRRDPLLSDGSEMEMLGRTSEPPGQ